MSRRSIIGAASGGGGGGGGTTVINASLVFRPGGVAANNIYTSWSALVTAAAATSGPKVIWFDTTGAGGDGNCHVPTGSWDLGYGAIFTGETEQYWNGTGVVFDSGATLVQAPVVFSELNITCSGVAAVYSASTATNLTIELDNVQFNASTCPLVSISGAGTLQLEMSESTLIAGSGYNFVAGAGGIFVYAGENAVINSNTLQATAGGTILLASLSASATLSTTQSPTATIALDCLGSNIFYGFATNTVSKVNAAGQLVASAITDDATTTTVGDSLAFSKALVGNKTATKTANYTALTTDYYVSCGNGGSPFTITLPGSPVTGQILIVKDSAGSAGTSTVTIGGNGKNIDGAANMTLSSNYASARLFYDGAQWLRDSSLASPGVTAGTYGTASAVGTFTVDNRGLVTSASNTNIAINASAITGGTLPIARGGTNSGTGLNNNRLIISSGSAIVEQSAVSPNFLIRADASGLPIGSQVTDDGTTTQVNDNFQFKQALIGHRTAALNANYTALTTDYLIRYAGTGSGVTVTLPASPVQDQILVIKDQDGTAAANNIIVSGNGHNIDGAATYTISTNLGSVEIYYNSTNWVILSAIGGAGGGSIDASQITTGVIPIARGGTNSGTALNNNRFVITSGGAIVEQSAIAASKIVRTDANGLPVASSLSDDGTTVTVAANVAVSGAAGTGALSLGSMTGATALPTGNLSWAGASTKTVSLVSTGAASSMTLTAGAASTWSTSAGALTMSGFAGINFQNNGTTVADVGVTGATSLSLGANQSLNGVAGTGALTLGSMTGATALPTGNLSWAGASTKTASLVTTGAGSTFTITAGAASTWGTSAGALTLNNFSGINFQKNGTTQLDIGVTASTSASFAAGVTISGVAGNGGLSLGAMTGVATLPTGNLSWAGASNKTVNLTSQGASGSWTLNSGTAAMTITAGAASTWSSTAALTLTAGAASTWSSSAGALTLTSAAAATWSTAAGALTVDSAAALNLGTSAATSVSLGKASNTTTSNGPLALSQSLLVNSVSKTANYTVTATDFWIRIGSLAGAITITLPSAPTTGQVIWVKDTAGTVSGTNMVTVDGNGKNIENAGTQVLNVAYSGFQIAYDGTAWWIMGR